MMVVDGVEVLPVREAAAYAGRTAETVRRWVWSGRLPARRHGNRLLVARRDLDALLQAPAAEALSLREWAAQLPQGSGRSAADLVLADRADRDGS
jgi:excisionase family DNA binding protein